MSSKDNGFDKEQFAHLQKVVKKKITHTVSNLKRSFSKFANQILQKGPKKRDEYLFEWADDLPPEIIVNVLSFLDYQDLCNCAIVSKKWNQCAESNWIWRNVYNQTFLTEHFDKNTSIRWKEEFEMAYLKLKDANYLVQSRPYECESYISRAICHAELRHYKASLKDMNEAIHLKNTERKPSRSRDTTLGSLIIRRASIYRKLLNYEKSLHDVNESIRLEPNNSSFYRIRGNWAREDGDYKSALRDFNIAIELEPDISIYHFCKGLVLKETKDYQEAIVCFNRAIELDPKNPEYVCSRGRVYYFMNLYDEALVDLNKAIDLDPLNSDYRHWRGRVKRDQNNCNEAMEDFEEALRISSDDIDYAWRGIMHSHLKNHEKSLVDINKAIQLSPENSFHYQFRGVIYFGLERYKDSMEDFKKAIEILPSWPSHYVWKSAVHFEQGDKRKTIQELNKAIAIRVDEVTLFWRGLAHLDQGNIEEGIRDLEDAIRISETPTHSRIIFWRGVASYLDGDRVHAKKMFQQTVKLAMRERKVARFSEPARVLLLTRQDEMGAKNLYRKLFNSFYTVDNAKTEQTHIELLGKLFPENKVLKNIGKWFEKIRRRTYGILKKRDEKKVIHPQEEKDREESRNGERIGI